LIYILRRPSFHEIPQSSLGASGELSNCAIAGLSPCTAKLFFSIKRLKIGTQMKRFHCRTEHPLTLRQPEIYSLQKGQPGMMCKSLQEILNSSPGLNSSVPFQMN